MLYMSEKILFWHTKSLATYSVQYFEADLLWKINLKILNLEIILRKLLPMPSLSDLIICEHLLAWSPEKKKSLFPQVTKIPWESPVHPISLGVPCSSKFPRSPLFT